MMKALSTYYTCSLHGNVRAIEKPGEKPRCSVCLQPVLLRVRWPAA